LFGTVMSLYNFASHSIGHFHSLYLTSVLIFHPISNFVSFDT